MQPLRNIWYSLTLMPPSPPSAPSPTKRYRDIKHLVSREFGLLTQSNQSLWARPLSTRRVTADGAPEIVPYQEPDDLQT